MSNTNLTLYDINNLSCFELDTYKRIIINNIEKKNKQNNGFKL